MQKIGTALGLIAILALPAGAQQVAPGQWTGKVSPPNDETREITIDVVAAGDSVTATLRLPSIPEIPPTVVSGMKLNAEKRLAFGFTVPSGTSVQCTLAPQPDATYAGTCTDSSGDTVPMTLTPPKPKPEGGS